MTFSPLCKSLYYFSFSIKHSFSKFIEKLLKILTKKNFNMNECNSTENECSVESDCSIRNKNPKWLSIG